MEEKKKSFRLAIKQLFEAIGNREVSARAGSVESKVIGAVVDLCLDTKRNLTLGEIPGRPQLL